MRWRTGPCSHQNRSRTANVSRHCVLARRHYCYKMFNKELLEHLQSPDFKNRRSFQPWPMFSSCSHHWPLSIMLSWGIWRWAFTVVFGLLETSQWGCHMWNKKHSPGFTSFFNRFMEISVFFSMCPYSFCCWFFSLSSCWCIGIFLFVSFSPDKNE